MHQSGVCLPSLKKRLRPSLSCQFLEYAENKRNLIGYISLGDLELKNTDFSRRIKTSDWCIENSSNY